VHTVGTDHDACPLLDGAASPAAALDSGDSIAVPQQRLHVESFPQLCAGLDGRVHQQLVEQRAPGPEPTTPAVRGDHPALQRERAHIEDQVQGDRPAAGRGQPIEQSPVVHDLGAMRPDDVGGDGVARKRGLVDQ
jgi:hypothetical protein